MTTIEDDIVNGINSPSFYGSYFLPFSTGERTIYHYNHSAGDPRKYYLIHYAKKFYIKLYYKDNVLAFANEAANKLWDPLTWAEYPIKISLSDFFVMAHHNGHTIPIALNKISVDKIIKRLLKLIAFI